MILDPDIKKEARQRATLAGSPATIATAVLNFCVRDGDRCDHRAIATRLLFPPLLDNRMLIIDLSDALLALDLAYSFP